jgi:hypothetical protein
MDAGMLEEKKQGRSEISLSLPMLCLAYFLNIATAVSFSYIRFTLRSISMDATLGHFDKYCTSSVESASPLLRHQDTL